MSSDDDGYVSDRSTLPRFPMDFETWPREAQVQKMADKYKREGLIEEILRMSGVEPDRQYDTDTKLTKEELAAVWLTLEGIGHDL